MVQPMNTWQRVVAEAYADGDFAYIADMDNWPAELPRCDDTLFAHLMVELSTEAKCTSLAEAIKRVKQTIEDSETALKALFAIA